MFFAILSKVAPLAMIQPQWSGLETEDMSKKRPKQHN